MSTSFRYGRWYSVTASTLALAVAFGGGAAAVAAAAKPATVKACAAAKTGELRLADSKGKCAKGYKVVTWNQKGIAGAPGATGATGTAGATGTTGTAGAPGAAGTVDTSQFYNKAGSDARFLPLHSPSDDSDALGGIPPGSYVTSDNGLPSDQSGQTSLSTYWADLPAGTTDDIYPIREFLGRLTATCSDPAGVSLQYHFATGTTGALQISHGSGADTYSDNISVSGSLTMATVDHATYVVSYAGGSVSKIDVYTVNGPGGRNTCRIRTFYQRLIVGP